MKIEFSTILLLLTTLCNLNAIAQSYDSYFTGNPLDLETSPAGGSCMMGGASENDVASSWFLEQANGGDILVMRASGGDGYNDYFYTDLGISVNSVETIVFNDASAASEAYIHEKIAHAEAIWFAGGDQWDYVSYWRGTAIDSLVNAGIQNRNIVIGGTSAGMAILGEYYFSAANGTITSETSLNNPYHENVTVDSTAFLKVPYLDKVITDTHYDDPDRKGRHSTFLARILSDFGTDALGIACDEYTAICIDTFGIARAYGGYPTYDDNAYFIQTNCELATGTPEVCMEDNPLTWDRDNLAIRVYLLKGTAEGSQSFNLNTWKTGEEGEWLFWSINMGEFNELEGTSPDCEVDDANIAENSEPILKVYPNPTKGYVNIESSSQLKSVQLYGIDGTKHEIEPMNENDPLFIFSSKLDPGIYMIRIESTSQITYKRLSLY